MRKLECEENVKAGIVMVEPNEKNIIKKRGKVLKGEEVPAQWASSQRSAPHTGVVCMSTSFNDIETPSVTPQFKEKIH